MHLWATRARDPTRASVSRPTATREPYLDVQGEGWDFAPLPLYYVLLLLLLLLL